MSYLCAQITVKWPTKIPASRVDWNIFLDAFLTTIAGIIPLHQHNLHVFERRGIFNKQYYYKTVKHYISLFNFNLIPGVDFKNIRSCMFFIIILFNYAVCWCSIFIKSTPGIKVTSYYKFQVHIWICPRVDFFIFVSIPLNHCGLTHVGMLTLITYFDHHNLSFYFGQ